MAIPTIPDLRELMETGMHFGHASGKWHPKMKPYIFATRDKLHIIDLEKTREKLKEVLGILEERLRDGKTVVLVGTKKQISDRVKEIGERQGVPYVNVRWLGGTMTNFAEIQKSIERMKKTEAFLETEDATKILKKERVMMENELRRMHYKFEGLRNVNKKPDALFVIDPGHEHNAVKEARHEGIEIFGVVDTNSDPSVLNHLIPANDDAPKSLALLLDLIEQTMVSGLQQRAVKQAEEAKTAETEAEPEAVVESAVEPVPEVKEETIPAAPVSEESTKKKPAPKKAPGAKKTTTKKATAKK